VKCIYCRLVYNYVLFILVNNNKNKIIT